MKHLMITWTDIFEGIGSFFEWTFKGMRALGQIPNVFLWIFILGMLAYWCMRIVRYKKEATKNGTLE
jgi:hypothetical protein